MQPITWLISNLKILLLSNKTILVCVSKITPGLLRVIPQLPDISLLHSLTPSRLHLLRPVVPEAIVPVGTTVNHPPLLWPLSSNWPPLVWKYQAVSCIQPSTRCLELQCVFELRSIFRQTLFRCNATTSTTDWANSPQIMITKVNWAVNPSNSVHILQVASTNSTTASVDHLAMHLNRKRTHTV